MVASHQTSDLTAGRLLAGKYRLQAEIGRGAMGTVWRATNENLDQAVAIKIISPEHAGSQELRERFETEARAAAKLNSRFVVSVYDNGITESGLPFIVMELLNGESLEERVIRDGPLPIPEVTRIARHLARALSKAHAQGIIHRDLKPANIFLTHSDAEEDEGDWTAKILDFGIAKMDDYRERAATTQTGTVLGTPLFMAPEQVRGANMVDARADLYSFGMVVFNMLTAAFAFEGQSFGDLLVSICVEPLPDIRRFAPQLPPAMSPWFQRACAREPADRFESAEDLLNDLQVALGHAPSAGTVTSHASSPWALPPTPPPPPGAQWSEARASATPHLESAGASAVTVHEAPKRSRNLLVAALVLFGLGGASAIGLGLSSNEPKSAQQPAILEIPEPVQESTAQGASDTREQTGRKEAEAPPLELDSLPVEDEKKKVRPKFRPRYYPKPKASPAPRPAPGTPDLGF